MLATEKRDLMHPESGEWEQLRGIQPLPDQLIAVSAKVAKIIFLRRFNNLRWSIAA